MQDRYAFDQGDFSKLGLLRALAGPTGLRVGVLWCRTEPTARERTNRDGRHVGYLSGDPDRRWSACDPELYQAMRDGHARGERSIAALERLPAWPAGTVFFGERVPEDALDRAAWFARAEVALRGAQLVYCDPDNSVAVPPRLASPKHLRVEEAEQLFAGGASVVLYHHFHRSRPHPEQLDHMRTALEARLIASAPGVAVHGLHYRRGSSRAYLVGARPEHAAALGAAVAALRRSPWATHRHFA